MQMESGCVAAVGPGGRGTVAANYYGFLPSFLSLYEFLFGVMKMC